MPSDAVRLCCFFVRSHLARVRRDLSLMRYRIEMKRITASVNAAKMVQNQTIWYRTTEEFPRDVVRQTDAAFAIVEPAVAIKSQQPV